MNCNQSHCGRPGCEPCCHWRKKLELIEAGKVGKLFLTTGEATTTLPVSVSVPADVPGEKRTEGGIILPPGV